MIGRRKLLFSSLAAPAILRAHTALSAGCTAGKGPAATSSFITAEFATPTGATIVPQLWGVAMAGIGAASGNYGSAPWVSAVASLNFQFVRQHLGDLFQSVFPTYNATPNWTVVTPWLAGFRTAFPNAVLQIGGAWMPDYLNGGNGNWTSANSTDINWCVSMWTQLVAHLVAGGVTPTYVDGIFNEPDIQGLLNSTGTIISTSVVATVSAAVFNALAAIYPGMKFTGPCSAFFNPGYANPLRAAYPGLAYNSFHFYNPNDLSGGVENWSHLISAGMNQVAEGVTPLPSAAQPGLINEYAIDGGGSATNGQQIAAVFAAITLAICGNGGNVPIAGIWQVSTDDNFLVVHQSGTIHPNAYLLSKAGQTVFGPTVSCTNPAKTGTSTLYTTACSQGTTGLALLVSNYGASTVSGPIALSHWPVNSTGNGTINMWQQSTTPAGTTTSVSVAAGMTASISFPPLSNTILWTAG